MQPFELNSLFLTILLFLPLVGAGVIALAPNPDSGRVPAAIAIAVTGIELLLCTILAGNYNPITGSRANPFEFVDKFACIPQFNIQYQVGVDGLSLPMVLLTGLL